MSSSTASAATFALPVYPPAPPGVVRLLRRWHRLECWIAVLAFSFIALVLAIDVLGREAFGPVMGWLGVKVGATGLLGSQKLAVFALVIGSFCGIGLATASGVPLVPRVGFAWVPKAWGPRMDRLADLLTGLFLLGVTWYGAVFVLLSKQSGVLAAVINVSAWPIQAVIPLGFASAACRYFFFAAWPALRPRSPEFPMFILCGGVMTKGSTARHLIDAAASLTDHPPGGLAVACVMSCGVFAAISGSSIVTMLAIGTVMYPAMKVAGYGNRCSLGAIMAGGTLGIIIPPSIPLILYGLVTETSITDLFVAGIGPGLLLLTAFALYAMWVNRRLPRQIFDLAKVRAALRAGIWALLMPVILLGGIYTGYFSAIEAAAVSLVYELIVENFSHREFKPLDFYAVVLDASKLGGTLFPLLAVALSLNLVLTEHQVPGMMVEILKGFTDSALVFMLLVNVLLLVVGCLMTTGEAILILGPLLAPSAMAYGYDKVKFGIIMIVNLEIGILTPPVGLNPLLAMSTFKQKFGELVLAAAPFIVLMLGCLALIAWQPWISMALVNR